MVKRKTKLYEVVKASGMTQRELAIKSGLSESKLQELRGGTVRSRATDETKAKLAGALRLSDEEVEILVQDAESHLDPDPTPAQRDSIAIKREVETAKRAKRKLSPDELRAVNAVNLRKDKEDRRRRKLEEREAKMAELKRKLDEHQKGA
jgi:transcriptional regulator with XRE-family HTH domain